MCGLLNLKHLRNLSDEFIVEQWSENAIISEKVCSVFLLLFLWIPSYILFRILLLEKFLRNTIAA